MKIDLTTDCLKDPDAWHREWHDTRNAAVAQLVSDGAAGRFSTAPGDVSRDEANDAYMRWLFWRQTKPEAERPRSDQAASPDAYLYEGVTGCMERARADERQRIAKAISAGLKAILGDEFDALLYDIARANDTE